MRLITEIDNSATQRLRVITEDNISFDFLLQFNDNRQCWVWGLAYNQYAFNGSQLCANLNILHRYKYALPFGLACIIDDSIKVDPFRIDDFVTGRIKLYTLTKAEVEQLEAAIYG